MSKKIRVGVLMGGASAERQISLASGMGIASHLDPDRYEVVMLDPLALMAGNPNLSEEQRALARHVAAGGGSPEALPARDQELPETMQASASANTEREDMEPPWMADKCYTRRTAGAID